MTIQPDRGSSGRDAIAQMVLLREPRALRVTRVLQVFTFAAVREQTPTHRGAAHRLLLQTPALPAATAAALVDRLWSDFASRAAIWAKVCSSVPPGWAPAIAVEVATANPLLDAAILSHGRAQVRIDAMLDVLQTERSCHEIQQEWMDVMAELHQRAQSDTERVAGKGSEYLGGFLGRFGSTLMEVGVEQGLNLLDDLSATHTVIVDDLARMVLAVRAGIGNLDTDLVSDMYRTLLNAEHVMSRDVGEVKRRRNSSYEANRQLLLVQATIQMIKEASGQSPSDFADPVMPDVVGMRLTDAMHLLRNLGIKCRYQVTADPSGYVPSVRVPKNWVVRLQAPAPKQPMSAQQTAVLEVQRFGNDVLANVAAMRGALGPA